jgi:Domain of unknown function (DUF4386)
VTLAPNPFAIAADLLFPEPSTYLNDPVGWVAATTKEFMWSKQREIAQSVRENRYTAVRSCHGSGKSFTASRIASWWLDVHAPGEAFIVTTAPTYKQVHAVLWREIGRAHRLGDLDGRINQDDEWYMGNELVGFGRKPADNDPAGFSGVHARYVLVIIDEAGGVPEAIYNAVDSLAIDKHNRILAIGNPDDPAAHFAKIHKPGSGWNRIHISVPVHDPRYILGPGPDTAVIFGGILEVIVALAGVGTAVALYPVLKRQNQGVALGLVGSRVLEGAGILAGVACLLAIVSLRQIGAGSGALVASQTLAILYDRIFHLSQGFMPAVDDLLLGYLLYKSRLVPRVLPWIAFIGAPLLLISWLGVLLNFWGQRSAVTPLAALPVTVFEFSLGVYLIVKGFKPSPITADMS